MLWHAHGRKPPPELLSALSRRQLIVRAVDNGFAALAEVCVLDHRTPGRAILLLVEPTALDEPESVLEAARRYTPGAVLWVYEPGANKPLRELVEERPVQRQASAPTHGHALRLTGEGPGAVDLEWPDDEEPEMGQILTDEELSMLLDEPRAGGGADVD